MNDQLDLSEIFLKGRKTQIPLKLPLRTVWKVYYFHSRYAIMLRYNGAFSTFVSTGCQVARAQGIRSSGIPPKTLTKLLCVLFLP